MEALAQPPPEIPQWFQELCQRLRLEQIRNINLNLRHVTPLMVVHLAEALEGNRSLEVLNLTSAFAGTVGFLAADEQSDALLPLARALQHNVSLKTLHLSYNKLVDLPCLATFLFNGRSKLIELCLDHNNANDATGVVLAKILSQNTSLSALQIDYNKIGDRGGVAIAKSLVLNQTLKTLGFRSNCLGTRTANAFLEALQERNTSLHDLFLGSNHEMPEKTVDKCRYLVIANRSGRYLLHDDDQARNKARNEKGKGRTSRKDDHTDGRRSLWPKVLEKADANAMFFFLVQKPNLVPSSHGG